MAIYHVEYYVEKNEVMLSNLRPETQEASECFDIYPRQFYKCPSAVFIVNLQ